MKRLALVTLASLAVSGCYTAHEYRLENLHAGMNRDEVQAALGAPEGSVNSPGQDCAYYTVLKSFWRRTPWTMTERYRVCYTDGKVDTFGRADAPAGQG